MSTFLIPSPSLPHPRSLKIAALLNRLSLSFICHSPHHAPHSPALSVFYLFSLLPPPSPPPSSTHTSHWLCMRQCIAQQSFLYILFSSIYSLPYSALCRKPKATERKRERKASRVSPLYVRCSLRPTSSPSLFALYIAPALCAPSISLPLPVLPPSLSDPGQLYLAAG